MFRLSSTSRVMGIIFLMLAAASAAQAQGRVTVNFSEAAVTEMGKVGVRVINIGADELRDVRVQPQGHTASVAVGSLQVAGAATVPVPLEGVKPSWRVDMLLPDGTRLTEIVTLGDIAVN